MQISIKSYAKALFEAAQDASKPQLKNLVDNWLGELAAKNLLNKIPAALREIEKLDDAAEGVIRADITAARKISRSVLEQIEKIVMKRTGAKKILWQEEIDESILGGAVVSYNDTVLDISLKQAIAELTFEISK